MKRTIKALNNLSFDLPEGWEVSSDRYRLSNGQGFINKENYLSKNGKVISLFELYRDPNEFFEYYQKLVESYNKDRDFCQLENQFTLKFGEYEFPVYIIKGMRENVIYTLQVFVNCGDRLGCFMINIDNISQDPKELIKANQTFSALCKILRTIE